MATPTQGAGGAGANLEAVMQVMKEAQALQFKYLVESTPVRVATDHNRSSRQSG
jgi:hypothetical protein